MEAFLITRLFLLIALVRCFHVWLHDFDEVFHERVREKAKQAETESLSIEINEKKVWEIVFGSAINYSNFSADVIYEIQRGGGWGEAKDVFWQTKAHKSGFVCIYWKTFDWKPWTNAGLVSLDITKKSIWWAQSFLRQKSQRSLFRNIFSPFTSLESFKHHPNKFAKLVSVVKSLSSIMWTRFCHDVPAHVMLRIDFLLRYFIMITDDHHRHPLLLSPWRLVKRDGSKIAQNLCGKRSAVVVLSVHLLMWKKCKIHSWMSKSMKLKGESRVS